MQEYITQSNEAILEQTSAKTSEITEIDKEIAMIDEKLALLKSMKDSYRLLKISMNKSANYHIRKAKYYKN